MTRVGLKLEHPCRECGEDFRPIYGDKRRVFCSDACSQAWGRHARRGRGTDGPRRRGANKIRRLRPRLLGRFEGRCGICGRVIDLTLHYLHPLALTIDHIVPLAAGGSDDDANLWPAHRHCNEDKGDELGWRVGGLHSMWSRGGGSV